MNSDSQGAAGAATAGVDRNQSNSLFFFFSFLFFSLSLSLSPFPLWRPEQSKAGEGSMLTSSVKWVCWMCKNSAVAVGQAVVVESKGCYGGG